MVLARVDTGFGNGGLGEGDLARVDTGLGKGGFTRGIIGRGISAGLDTGCCSGGRWVPQQWTLGAAGSLSNREDSLILALANQTAGMCCCLAGAGCAWLREYPGLPSAGLMGLLLGCARIWMSCMPYGERVRLCEEFA